MKKLISHISNSRPTILIALNSLVFLSFVFSFNNTSGNGLPYNLNFSATMLFGLMTMALSRILEKTVEFDYGTEYKFAFFLPKIFMFYILGKTLLVWQGWDANILSWLSR